METQTIDTFQFGDKYYVLIQTAAKYLLMSVDMLSQQVTLGNLETKKFGARQFIELETLKAYAESKQLNTDTWSAAVRGA
jgi:hypothetical protein